MAKFLPGSLIGSPRWDPRRQAGGSVFDKCWLSCQTEETLCLGPNEALLWSTLVEWLQLGLRLPTPRMWRLGQKRRILSWNVRPFLPARRCQDHTLHPLDRSLFLAGKMKNGAFWTSVCFWREESDRPTWLKRQPDVSKLGSLQFCYCCFVSL